MKMIKKSVLVLIIALVALTAFASKSSAMTKDELEDYMLGEQGFAGTNLHACPEDKTKIGRFFDSVDMTEAQADEIKALIDAAVAFMNGDGATHPNGMSTTAKKRKLLGYAEQAAAVLGLTITYDAGEERLDIYKDGKQIESLNWGVEGTTTTTSTGNPKTKNQSSRPALNQTGSTNYGYLAVAGVVLVAGITLVIARKNAIKANA